MRKYYTIEKTLHTSKPALERMIRTLIGNRKLVNEEKNFDREKNFLGGQNFKRKKISSKS